MGGLDLHAEDKSMATCKRQGIAVCFSQREMTVIVSFSFDIRCPPWQPEATFRAPLPTKMGPLAIINLIWPPAATVGNTGPEWLQYGASHKGDSLIHSPGYISSERFLRFLHILTIIVPLSLIVTTW